MKISVKELDTKLKAVESALKALKGANNGLAKNLQAVQQSTKAPVAVIQTKGKVVSSRQTGISREVNLFI